MVPSQNEHLHLHYWPPSRHYLVITQILLLQSGYLENRYEYREWKNQDLQGLKWIPKRWCRSVFYQGRKCWYCFGTSEWSWNQEWVQGQCLEGLISSKSRTIHSAIVQKRIQSEKNPGQKASKQTFGMGNFWM